MNPPNQFQCDSCLHRWSLRCAPVWNGNGYDVCMNWEAAPGAVVFVDKLSPQKPQPAPKLPVWLL